MCSSSGTIYSINLLWQMVSIKNMNAGELPLRKMCQITGFFWPIFSRIRTESWILSLYRKIRVRENLYSSIFYAVIISNKCSSSYDSQDWVVWIQSWVLLSSLMFYTWILLSAVTVFCCFFICNAASNLFFNMLLLRLSDKPIVCLAWSLVTKIVPKFRLVACCRSFLSVFDFHFVV